jgi:hypothetical protein
MLMKKTLDFFAWLRNENKTGLTKRILNKKTFILATLGIIGLGITFHLNKVEKHQHQQVNSSVSVIYENNIKPPLVTVFTTPGKGQYIVPDNTTYIQVEMVGGGSSGFGYVNSKWTAGSGENTTFDNSLLVAEGANARKPGGGSIGHGALGIVVSGETGSSGNCSKGNNEMYGGSTPLGSGSSVAGGNAQVNTGSGGGAITSELCGHGGNSGGYVKAIIDKKSLAWAKSFSYSIGSGGSMVSSKYLGGKGGSGFIAVTAYAQ